MKQLQNNCQTTPCAPAACSKRASLFCYDYAVRLYSALRFYYYYYYRRVLCV